MKKLKIHFRTILYESLKMRANSVRKLPAGTEGVFVYWAEKMTTDLQLIICTF